MSSLVKKSLEQQKAKIAEAKKIHAYAEGEGRELTADEQASIDAIMIDCEKLANLIKQTTKLEQVEAESEAIESSLKQSKGRISKPQQFAPVHEDVNRYSLVRAIRCMVENGRLDGVEAEVSAEIASRYGKKPRGFYAPHQRYGNLDLTTGAGAIDNHTDHSNFIDLLRNKMVLQELGAKVLTDLSGNVSIPRQSGGATAYWIQANGSNTITNSNQTIDYVPLTPKTVGARTLFPRDLVSQTSMDVEKFIMNDLSTVLAIELDRVGINGSGSGAEPEGIFQNSDVEVVEIGASGGAPTYAKIVALETAVAAGNADLGALAYLMSPQARGKLKTTPVASNTAKMIWENDLVNGYKAVASNQVPSNFTKGAGSGLVSNLSGCCFGNYNDALYGLWGGVDIIVNPYTNDAAGAITVTALQDAYFALRHPESFAVIVDMITA